MTRRRDAVFLAVMAVLLAGCGSTATPPGSGAASLGAPANAEPDESWAALDNASPVPAPPRVVDPRPVPTTAPAQRNAAGGTGTATTAEGTAPARGGAAAAAANAPVTGRGVTARTITIGMFRNRNFEPSGLPSGITQAHVDDFKQVLIDDLNQRGGIAGREVVPVWYETDVRHDDDAVRTQGACSAFTQDHQVFAVLTFQVPNDAAVECLERTGVVLIAASLSWADRRTFEQFPRYFEAQTVNLTRLAQRKVEELYVQGFLTPSSRIGLVHFDTPRHQRAVDQTLRPALAARGLHLEAVSALSRPQSSMQLPALQAAIASTVLQFKRVGIDRVIFLTWSNSVPLGFMLAAEQQNFSPRYGLDTHDDPGFLSARVPRQLRGAVGFGWSPLNDVSEPDDPGANASQRRCLELAAAHGYRPTRRNDDMIAMAASCDLVWFFEAAVKRAPALTADGFVQGAESLADTWEAATVEKTGFGPGRHDGAAAYRRLAFFDDCTCFRYTSPAPILLP